MSTSAFSQTYDMRLSSFCQSNSEGNSERASAVVSILNGQLAPKESPWEKVKQGGSLQYPKHVYLAQLFVVVGSKVLS